VTPPGRWQDADVDLRDADRCYDALVRRDARFDGWFVVGVTSTGIYCRPSCPAPVRPKRANVRFYPTAAAAQQAGFRTCKRCRPDATPGSPDHDRRQDLVGRAVRAIDDGVVDRDGVTGLARRLGVSSRHLGRVLQAELGAGPLQLARAGRAHRARVLLETTTLPIADVAFAAGFGSVRQCNDTIRAVFAVTPGDLRRSGRSVHPDAGSATGALVLRLPLRPPIDRTALLAALARHAVPGLERVHDGAYERTLRLPGGAAKVVLRPATDHVSVTARLERLADLGVLVHRCRRLLDLDADPLGAAEALAADAVIGPVLVRSPGRRVPGAADGFEGLVRAVVGQQVSTGAAAQVLARIVAVHGDPGPEGDGLLFPTPDTLAAADPATLPLPAARARTVVAVASLVADGGLDLGPAADPDEVLARLGAVPGVGPWTLDVVRLRVLRDPDVFPVGDLALRRGAAALGLPTDTDALARCAAAWRPHRSLVAEHLIHPAPEEAP
jgi:AraC family transcriptional regulator of adaptative response / DNA-3-methyladenine glycosylase II